MAEVVTTNNNMNAPPAPQPAAAPVPAAAAQPVVAAPAPAPNVVDAPADVADNAAPVAAAANNANNNNNNTTNTGGAAAAAETATIITAEHRVEVSKASNTTGWLSVSINPHTKLPEASVTLRVIDLIASSASKYELSNMVEIVRSMTIIKRLHIRVDDRCLGWFDYAVVPLLEAYVENQQRQQQQMLGAVLPKKRELILEVPFGNEQFHDFLTGAPSSKVTPAIRRAVTQLWIHCNTTTKGISHRKRSVRALAVSDALPNCSRLRIMGSYSVPFVKDLATASCGRPIPGLKEIKFDGIASVGQVEHIVQFLELQQQQQPQKQQPKSSVPVTTLAKVEIPMVYNLEAGELLVEFWNKMEQTNQDLIQAERQRRNRQIHQEDGIQEMVIGGTQEEEEELDQLKLKGGIESLHIHRITSTKQARQMVSILRAHPHVTKLKVKESVVDAARIWLQYIQQERMSTLEFSDKEEIRLIAPSAINSDTTATTDAANDAQPPPPPPQQQQYWEVGALYHDFTGMGFHTKNPWGLGIIPEGYDEKISMEETAPPQPQDDTTEDKPTVLDIEVAKLVELTKTIMSEGVVYVTLSKNEVDQDYCKRVAYPIIEAAHMANAEEIALHLGFHNRQILQLLNVQVVRDAVTFIEPWDEVPPVATTVPVIVADNNNNNNNTVPIGDDDDDDEDENKSQQAIQQNVATTISLLNRLKTLMLCGAPQSLLHWLATRVNFHPALKQIDVWDVRSEAQINEVKLLLKNNPSIVGFDMYDSTSDWDPTKPHHSVLDLITKPPSPAPTDDSDGNGAIQLEKFSFHTKRHGAVTDSIITALSGIFATNQLSPSIKTLDMSFGVDIPTKNSLKNNLLPALENNHQTQLSLSEFTLKLYDSLVGNHPTDVAGHWQQVPHDDDSLTVQCKAFAIQKTMERVAASIGDDATTNNNSAGGSNTGAAAAAAAAAGPLPLSALPNAVDAVRNNPRLVRSLKENKRGIITTNMIWHGLKRKIATDRAIGSVLMKIGKRMMTAVAPTTPSSTSTTSAASTSSSSSSATTSSGIGTITTTTITSGTFRTEVDC